ncbi:MAG: hypothetical protein O3C31_03485 [Bacteroidetes bacterium]|nr:hypothetical protein [Bacteroidota bacterium]MDA0885566.1 hypothetical protein [Bacteroidota bacterium]MDA1225525.1 hypothetical protein [Bacteroidota bacterium]
MKINKKLISKKKPFYPISEELKFFLKQHDRWMGDVISYDDLLRYSDSINLYDKKNKDTLWVRLIFNESERQEIDKNLKIIYTLLHSDGNTSSIPYLNIDSVDYCTFGNSKPFRVKIRNIVNDNFTYFYVKKTDASRVYGIEFEHMLSPRNLNFLVNNSSLIEEHIAGIPGDIFIQDYLPKCTELQKSQIAKEYVKFNERCMIRLLGDMRSYNYVVIPIHDFDQVIYKIRAIDFDQQCFEGRFSVYRPQFFKENKPMMDIVRDKLKTDSIIQYKIEERSTISRRLIISDERIKLLINIMKKDTISKKENVENLKNEIYKFTKEEYFKKCDSMGELMEKTLDYLKRNYQNVSLRDLI